MTRIKKEQELFWSGEFGNDYVERNQGEKLLASNFAFFSRALQHTQQIGSIIEFGANIGMNLKALHPLLPQAELHGVEINTKAYNELRTLPNVTATNSAILDYQIERTFDLVLIKTVLIHVNPDDLPEVYDRLVAASKRYVLVAEYYNPVPVDVNYRGHSERLFKRDFAGEIMARHPDLELVDYGFLYHRDPKWPSDDITWFLMQKRDSA